MCAVDVLDLEETLFVLLLSLEPLDSAVLQLVGIVVAFLIEVAPHDLHLSPDLVLGGLALVSVHVSHHVVALVPVTQVFALWLTRCLEYFLELLERLVDVETRLGGLLLELERDIGCGVLRGEKGVGDGTCGVDRVFATGAEGGEGREEVHSNEL